MKVLVTVKDGKVLLDADGPEPSHMELEVGEAIDLASEMLGAAMIAQPAEQGLGALGNRGAVRAQGSVR